jgi:hypothetical protein
VNGSGSGAVFPDGGVGFGSCYEGEAAWTFCGNVEKVRHEC